MKHNHTDHHEAPVNAGAYLYPNPATQGEAMTEIQTSESIPSEHDEEVCSKGETLCEECYSAGADCGPA